MISLPSQRCALSRFPHILASLTEPSQGIAESTAAAGLLASKSRSTNSAAQDLLPTSSTSTDTKQQVKRAIPEDACLILSDNLYFTRSQCAFMGAVVVGAYVWGKLS